MAFRYRRSIKRKRSADSSRWVQLQASGFISGYQGTSGDVATMANSQISYDSGKSAAKITMEAGDRTTLQTQFELITPEYVSINSSTGTYLATVDVWLDPTMREVPQGGNYNTDGGGVNWKFLQSLYDISTDAGAITWEPWLNPGDGTADGIAHVGSRSYPSLVTGQSNRQPYEPRGLLSKIYAPGPLMVPYGQWVRFVILHELNLDETAFDDWNTEIGVSGPLAAGTYHRMSQWVQIGSTVYCMYWKVPMGRVVGPSTRTHLKQWGVEMDTSQDSVKATGTVRFTGSDGSTIPSGTFIYTGDGLKRYRTQALGTIAGGVADVLVEASLASGTPKTAGYFSNCNAGTAFTFSPGSAPSGVNDASSALTAIAGGKDVIEADAYVWFRHMAVLQNYSLPSDPATDTLIFANDLAS